MRWLPVLTLTALVVSAAEQDILQPAPIDPCIHHSTALDLLASFPWDPPRSLIPPQSFLTLANPPLGSSSSSLFLPVYKFVYTLRQYFWKEGYEARLPAGGKERRSGGEGGGRKAELELVEKARNVLKELRLATDGGCVDAWGTRGQIAMFPPAPLRQDLKLAYHAYEEHARLTGNATAQYMLGFFHATGYGDIVPIDQGQALLHYSFAALQSHPGAEHALAYKYWAGIGVEEDCMMALSWFESSAERVFQQFLSGPPGGRTLPITSTRLSDLAGGVYGLGASWASTGMNTNRAPIKAGIAKSGGETWDDFLEYYQYYSERGSHSYSVKLGKFYYMGSIYTVPGGLASGAEGAGRIPQSFDLAATYFFKAARPVWPSDSVGSGKRKIKGGRDMEFEQTTLDSAAISAGFLGRMYLRGEIGKGRMDYQKAKLWFERGAEYGERESYNGLGIIYRDGLSVKPDLAKAKWYFEAAASLEHAEAQVNLAKMLLAQGDPFSTSAHLSQALRFGSPFEAFYHLGKMYASNAKAQVKAGLRPETCAPAVAHLKLVVERGSWKDDVVGSADEAWERGESDKAILGWWMAGERGYESAQNNLAFLLDQDRPLYSLPWRQQEPDNVTAKISLNHWTRSAAQGEIDSLVKVGDYFYKGLDGSGEPQYEKAAGYYQAAAERQDSALALFNLGYMYENGLGVPKDWHLAKRNYDLAFETNLEASFPVTLALTRLYAKSLWSTLTGGQEKGISPWSSTEGKVVDVQSWSFSSIKDGIVRRLMEIAGDLEEGGEGYWDETDEYGAGEDQFDEGGWTAMGRERRESEGEQEEEVWFETILLVVLCLLVAGLSWLRTRWTRQREEERREAAQPAPGQVPAQPPVPPRQDLPGPPWHPLV